MITKHINIEAVPLSLILSLHTTVHVKYSLQEIAITDTIRQVPACTQIVTYSLVSHTTGRCVPNQLVYAHNSPCPKLHLIPHTHHTHTTCTTHTHTHTQTHTPHTNILTHSHKHTPHTKHTTSHKHDTLASPI